MNSLMNSKRDRTLCCQRSSLHTQTFSNFTSTLLQKQVDCFFAKQLPLQRNIFEGFSIDKQGRSYIRDKGVDDSLRCVIIDSIIAEGGDPRSGYFGGQFKLLCVARRCITCSTSS